MPFKHVLLLLYSWLVGVRFVTVQLAHGAVIRGRHGNSDSEAQELTVLCALEWRQIKLIKEPAGDGQEGALRDVTSKEPSGVTEYLSSRAAALLVVNSQYSTRVRRSDITH